MKAVLRIEMDETLGYTRRGMAPGHKINHVIHGETESDAFMSFLMFFCLRLLTEMPAL